MSLRNPRKFILSSFLRTECCIEEVVCSTRREINLNEKSLSYFVYPHPFLSLPGLPKNTGSNFPVVLCKDGSIWAEASLHILHRFEINPSTPNDTLQSVATDLAAYRLFLDSESIEFDVVPSDVYFRPTYRFHAYLKRLIAVGSISASTANRRIGRVIELYRWLDSEGIFSPNYPLWRERPGQISYSTAHGERKFKQILITDLSIKNIQKTGERDFIFDGGKLIPLSLDHQVLLLKTLNKLQNIEMELIHLVAIFTGARLQTVLTLRLSDVNVKIDANPFCEVRVPIGGESLVESKFSKKHVICIPMWLCKKLKIYALSMRAKRRQNKSGGAFDAQYLFLNNRGDPYYLTKNSSEIKKKSGFRGEAIRQFIKDKVIHEVRKLEPDFFYSFHWLRATYAMNLLDLQLDRVEKGEIKLGDALNFVRERMGHSNFKTTERYLNYRNLHSISSSIAQKYYLYLQNIMSEVV